MHFLPLETTIANRRVGGGPLRPGGRPRPPGASHRPPQAPVGCGLHQSSSAPVSS